MLGESQIQGPFRKSALASRTSGKAMPQPGELSQEGSLKDAQVPLFEFLEFFATPWKSHKKAIRLKAIRLLGRAITNAKLTVRTFFT
jgi:hypothetical protein